MEGSSSRDKVMKADLLKIGILLIGISLIVIASIAVHFYITFIQRIPSPSPPQPFSAYCHHNAIVIHANQELEDVKVLDNSSKEVCFFERISAGSEELCMVEYHGFYIVQARDHKDIVGCWDETIMRRID